MSYFPMFIDLAEKKCVIIGGGMVALQKLKVLHDFSADIKLIAREICSPVREFCNHNQISYCEKEYEEKDLQEAFLVVAATNQESLNRSGYETCVKRRISVNVVDQPSLCTFIFPAYLREQNVVAAFSSSGKSPATVQYLKECMKDYLTEEVGEAAEYLGAIRPYVQQHTENMQQRKMIYRKILERILQDGAIPDEKELKEIIEQEVENP